MLDINVDDFKRQIESRAEGFSDLRVQEDGDTRRYRFQKKEATLLLTVGPSWAGYELTVPKHVVGRILGTAEDTDNYPLGGKNSKITKEVFKNCLQCLNNFLNDQIYVGKMARKYVFAMPLQGEYLLLSGGRFLMKKKRINAAEFATVQEYLRRIKD